LCQNIVAQFNCPVLAGQLKNDFLKCQLQAVYYPKKGIAEKKHALSAVAESPMVTISIHAERRHAYCSVDA
jgi:hypothetical protein